MTRQAMPWQAMGQFIAGPDEAATARSVWLVAPAHLEQALAALPKVLASHARRCGFAAKEGEMLLLPEIADAPAAALAGAGNGEEHGADIAMISLSAGALASKLPEGVWRFDTAHAPHLQDHMLALGWLLSAYRFSRYKSANDQNKAQQARLLPPAGVNMDEIGQQAESVWLGRDLINTPASDLGPAQLAEQARALAETFGADFSEITGEALARGFPLIHAVGKGAEEARAPRLIEMRWQDANGGVGNGADDGVDDGVDDGAGNEAPLITLVGKGVCFDSGGLDIKPSSAMALMKKDMGGAATALACARMIMAARLPVRLRVLIAAVENAVSGASFRPGDVLRSRAGLTVEVGNTDAEGRLILADALALADEEKPDLLVDFATLTGAARVALGPDLPPVFSPEQALAGQARDVGMRVADTVWPLPLHTPYMDGLKSDIADLNNIAANGFAGSIIAALFLSRFVSHARHWLHFDIYGWTPRAQPARPRGGEPQAARLVYHLIRERFAS